MTITTTDNAPNELIAGRYKIERLLGEGGMGRVYLASDSILGDEQVALKVLHPHLCREEKHTQRFLREAQLTRRITHANVVRTFEVGSAPDLHFISMEYVQGVTLKEKLKLGPIPILAAARTVADIAHGLAAIHDANIIHRDLKPGNVIIADDGQVKITDFGVARPEVSDITAHNEVIGSVAYMAPEIWIGREITVMADLYSLGILAYELLTGEVPFGGTAPVEIMSKHLGTKPLDLSKKCPEIPLWFSSLVMSMLSKDPGSRPASAVDINKSITEQLSQQVRPNQPAVLGPLNIRTISQALAAQESPAVSCAKTGGETGNTLNHAKSVSRTLPLIHSRSIDVASTAKVKIGQQAKFLKEIVSEERNSSTVQNSLIKSKQVKIRSRFLPTIAIGLVVLSSVIVGLGLTHWLRSGTMLSQPWMSLGFEQVKVMLEHIFQEIGRYINQTQFKF